MRSPCSDISGTNHLDVWLVLLMAADDSCTCDLCCSMLCCTTLCHGMLRCIALYCAVVCWAVCRHNCYLYDILIFDLSPVLADIKVLRGMAQPATMKVATLTVLAPQLSWHVTTQERI